MIDTFTDIRYNIHFMLSSAIDVTAVGHKFILQPSGRVVFVYHSYIYAYIASRGGDDQTSIYHILNITHYSIESVF